MGHEHAAWEKNNEYPIFNRLVEYFVVQVFLEFMYHQFIYINVNLLFKIPQHEGNAN